MKLKNFLNATLFIIVLPGFAVYLAGSFYFSPKISIESNLDLTAQNSTASSSLSIYGLPVRLKIPKINVDATVQQVGITSTGAMDVPKLPSDVAWLNIGPRPGEKGSAVIDGHFGWKNGIPAVFDNLYKLKRGDRVYVEDDKGATITFVVRELRTYGLNWDTSDVFTSNDGKAHLNLVTCEGVWNKTQKSYSKRLIVFTDKETL